MKSIKVVISFLLIAVLLLSPCTVSAQIASSGKCGDNVTYTLSADGLLTISGKGDMYNYTSDSPFYKSTAIKEIVIKDGVTSVGVWAFSKCSSLKSVEMADSVTFMGSCAFYECTSLTDIQLSNNVDGVNSHTFYGCSALTEISIPDTAKIIDDYAFFSCESLKSASIGDGVETISRYAFVRCTALTDVSIGNGLQKIGELAFNGCSSIETITVGTGLKQIDYGAFIGCKALTSLHLPEGMESIGNHVFAQCSSLTDFTVGNNLKHMGQNAISSTGWYANQANGIVTFGGVVVGYKGTIPKKLDLSSTGANAIADYAFQAKTTVTDVILPESIKYIGNYAFQGCTLLANIGFTEGIESIGDYAFSGCTAIASLTLPESLKEIGNRSFYGCSAMVTAVIGKNVSKIGQCSFSNCALLETITVDDENNYYCDIDGVVYDKNITTLVQCPLGIANSKCTIPYTITNIEDLELGYKNGNLVPLNFYIYGYRYTAAENYAKANKISFKYLDDMTITSKGDVNKDGDVSVADAVISARFSAELNDVTVSQQLAGDLNGDQKLNVSDAVLMSRYAAGLSKLDDYSWMLKDTSKAYSSSSSGAPDESYVYKTVLSKKLIVNVYYPAGGLEETNAAVICYEGSAWNPANSTTTSWPGSYLKHTAQYFASKGFVGIEVNYRSLYTDYDTSVMDCIEDCADGYKFVTENLKYIDPEMTVIAGESAGGHIALMMELNDLYTGTARPQAVIAMNPTIYLDRGYCLRTSLYQLAPSFQGLKDASPIYNVNKTDTKIILTQGEHDTITPLSYAEEFYDKMTAAGNDIEMLVFDDQEHSCLLYNYLNTDAYINYQMNKIYRLTANALVF